MQSAAETVENASILSSGSSQEGHRLWIGNIDPKITEYHLVKLLEKFGKVKQFDFLFHKSGPLEGQPRGYCFVNFHTKEEAERAIQCLNGKLALSKKLVVRWAHAQRFEPYRGDKNMPASLEPSSSEAEELPTSLRFHKFLLDTRQSSCFSCPCIPSAALPLSLSLSPLLLLLILLYRANIPAENSLFQFHGTSCVLHGYFLEQNETVWQKCQNVYPFRISVITSAWPVCTEVKC
ncbi:putative RNA-binding protein 18 isoform X2 [Brachyhypopomus gauderio]